MDGNYFQREPYQGESRIEDVRREGVLESRIEDMRRSRAIERFMANVLRDIHTPGTGDVGNGDNLVDRLFRETRVRTIATDKQFVKGLVVHEAQDDLQEECSICLDSFKKGDRYIELPCNDKPHRFHYKEAKEGLPEDTCLGIGPWLEVNHRCPVCRHELPKEPEPEPGSGSGPELDLSDTSDASDYEETDETDEAGPSRLINLSDLLDMIYPGQRINRSHEPREPGIPPPIDQPPGPLAPLHMPLHMPLRMPMPIHFRPVSTSMTTTMDEDEQMQRAIEASFQQSHQEPEPEQREEEESEEMVT